MKTQTPFAELSGGRLLLAAFVIALSNFMVVLDTTIANVSVPHITGNLAVSSTQGTWVVTSYAVAEAICVPLTGWLAGRFGTVRVFILGLIGFTVFSFLCGLATSLEMLVFFRIGQAGPLWWSTYATQPNLAYAYFPTRKTCAGNGPMGNDHSRWTNFRANFGWSD